MMRLGFGRNQGLEKNGLLIMADYMLTFIFKYVSMKIVDLGNIVIQLELYQKVCVSNLVAPGKR